MEKIKVKKHELLAVLENNRAVHRKIFEEALEGYKKEAIRVLEDQLALAKANKRVNNYIQIDQPVDQTREYDRAIAMMKMSVDDEIYLTEHDFKAFVMDDWTWKQDFLSSNSKYSSSAMMAMSS